MKNKRLSVFWFVLSNPYFLQQLCRFSGASRDRVSHIISLPNDDYRSPISNRQTDRHWFHENFYFHFDLSSLNFISDLISNNGTLRSTKHKQWNIGVEKNAQPHFRCIPVGRVAYFSIRISRCHFSKNDKINCLYCATTFKSSNGTVVLCPWLIVIAMANGTYRIVVFGRLFTKSPLRSTPKTCFHSIASLPFQCMPVLLPLVAPFNIIISDLFNENIIFCMHDVELHSLFHPLNY